MEQFCQRLKEERKRLRLNQTDFGGVGGVVLATQSDYEIGKSCPDARYLSAIAAAGADVCYILTGTRTPTATASPDESALLDAYRKCPAPERALISSLLTLLAQRQNELHRSN